MNVDAGIPIMYAEYGFGSDYSESDAYQEELACVRRSVLRAFMLGHDCKFRGPQASPILSEEVPRQHRAIARGHFHDIEGTSHLGRQGVLPAGMTKADVDMARRVRERSLQHLAVVA